MERESVYIPGEFRELVRQRQDLVYQRGIPHTSNSVVEIDTRIAEIARHHFTYILLDFAQPNFGWDVEMMHRWARYYQKPTFIRHTLERLNQILGYRGSSE